MKQILLALLLFLLFPFGVKAQSIEDHFNAACAKSGVPIQVAKAIAKHESGMKPFAINVAGKGFFPKTRQEAEVIIADAWAAGQSFDVGLMQVNSWWMKKYNIKPTDLLEPELNIAWGIYILSSEIQRYGLNWQAIGAYHSPNQEKARLYSWMVYGKLKVLPKLASVSVPIKPMRVLTFGVKPKETTVSDSIFQKQFIIKKAPFFHKIAMHRPPLLIKTIYEATDTFYAKLNNTRLWMERTYLYAEQKESNQNIRHTGRIWRNPDKRHEVRVISFDIR